METACVFCDRSQFEERLCGEPEDFWIIATLGQITDGGYVILVPKRHMLCIGAMERSEIVLVDEMEKKICDALIKEYSTKTVTIFEHGIVGQSIKHAHLHLMPVECNMTDRIEKDFQFKTELATLKTFKQLRDLYIAHPEPYLLWRDNTGPFIKMYLDPQNVLPQYCA